MRQMTIVLFAAVLCLGTFVQCDKKKSGDAPAKGGDMKPVMGMDTMAGDMGGDMRVTPGMTTAPPVTSGPTGIKECDTLLDMLSRCHKKDASLAISYKTMLKDAPGWKAKAQKRDPKQIAELAAACVRISKQVRESFGCK